MSDQHLGNVPSFTSGIYSISLFWPSLSNFFFCLFPLLLKFKYKRYENKRQYRGAGIISTRTCFYLVLISASLLATCVLVDLEAHNS